MTRTKNIPDLTPALEDYLETVFRLVSTQGEARVRDIAAAREVRPGSVSPAMQRLEQLGLIAYERREHVTLTAAGLEAARRVYARHQVLRRFFRTFLDLPAAIAEADACAVEHSLSPQTLDRLVRLFEYMEVCPDASTDFDRFRNCSVVNPGADPCPHDCGLKHHRIEGSPTMSIAELQPGQSGRVRQIEAQGAIRQRLLDMGLLPDVTLRLERKAPTGDPLWIRLQGFEMALRRSEARTVMVEAIRGS